MTTLIDRVLARLLLGAALLFTFALRSAAEDSPEKKSVEPDAIVKLEEFKVSTTVGTYAETASTSAGKIPIDMRDVPATLQVLNASFIGDKLAASLDDLYPYVVGMTRESPA